MKTKNNMCNPLINYLSPRALALLILLAVLAAGTGEARASLSFSETFLGSKTDANYYDVWQDWKARFAFNLTSAGDTATLYNASNSLVPGSTKLPTQDATTFVPNSYLINSAGLNFTISSSDLARETVSVHSALYDGNTCLREQTFALGNWITDITGQRKYADLNINLLALGLGQYLMDGKFVTLVIAPDTPSPLLNDFRIDMANLTVTADTTPTPIPAAAWLLGSGLLGLAGLRRKQK